MSRGEILPVSYERNRYCSTDYVILLFSSIINVSVLIIRHYMTGYYGKL